MDVVGSEIGHKMRSAIKAKLTELGCYVDDELPDYVMVMVANKRTRAQMEDDLQLFLGDNTELFVNWLHQVLKKLQEVTVTAPLAAELDKKKEQSVSKEKKDKEKKEKSKKGETSKKSKKKNKVRKKEEKKSHKKKKSKHEIIRPNIPPLLMNMEKHSEPSITDVFAGQILKNHGVLLESFNNVTDKKETKRPIIPIIDPATISSEPVITDTENIQNRSEDEPTTIPRDENIKEMNKIEAKIQGLRQKLAEQLDSMSDDEDFLNIRTEAEELMNDFAEDVFQEISQPPPVTPPLNTDKLATVEQPATEKPKTIISNEPETLPQIELNLPKRPVRERLGSRDKPVPEVKEKQKETAKKSDSPERFTPEREFESRPQSSVRSSAKSRLGSQSESHKKTSTLEEISDKAESSSKRLTSQVTSQEGRSGRSSCTSVVRVRPRPRVSAPASNLLLRAVADAHKSLLNIPPKVDQEPRAIKRALVLPMRRNVEPQKIVIQVPGDTQQSSERASSSEDVNSVTDGNTISDKVEYIGHSITKVINNTEYVPNRTTNRQDNILDSITVHNTTVDKDKGTQFIVTMDGYHPNAFLAKKLLTEGILDDEDIETSPVTTRTEIVETQPSETQEIKIEREDIEEQIEKSEIKEETAPNVDNKRLSNASEESDTQVIINQDKEKQLEKRKSTVNVDSLKVMDESPPIKKRKASPIIFDVDKKEKVKEIDREKVRERTVSASSDSVTLTTTSVSHKYDALPPLSASERKPTWCRTFPLCRYGVACAFQHPRCKFLAACTRRGCAYDHSPAAPLAPLSPLTPTAPVPVLASHVVPVANYKTISTAVVPGMCKFFPNCVNPACHFYHPKPCKFGKACTNKLECNFYHHDLPSKWKYSI